MDNIKRVKVANGFVEGKVEKVLERDIVQFLSIPYCKAPVKELRFKKPQPCETFLNGVINKLKFETCPPQQYRQPYISENIDEEVWIPKEIDDEDSLYVNVWCPLEILEGHENKAVFIFIYGGGFVSGSSSLDIYNGSILSSQENIIVVSFNYRISMLGFLCLDDHVKGNLGIWDQVLALKWIHQNISVFNGDPENITVAGNSAGGCSVSLHLLIEESWQYFTKVIIQSGVCLSRCGFLPREELNQRSVICVNEILRKHEFPVQWNSSLSDDDKNSIISFLQEVDVKEFLTDFNLAKGIAQFSWASCVDGELIRENPKILYESGKFKKCPTVFLNVENEGTFFLLLQFPDIEVDANDLVALDYFHESVKYYPYFPNLCGDSVKDKIKNEYNIQGEKFSVDILDKIIADEFFVCGSMELANIVSKFHKEVYYLWFNTPSFNINWPKWCGIMHSEEIYYLFGETLKMESGFSDSAKENSRLLMNQFGHFMMDGKFLHDVPSYDEESRRYVSIEGNEWISKIFSEDQFKKVVFWKNLQDS